VGSAALGAATTAGGQEFFNLDFEQATGTPHSPPREIARGWYETSDLSWNTAVPGWSHSAGSDTSFVYWGDRHRGGTQFYLLMDEYSPGWAPNTQLSGRYSLCFASGIKSFPDFTWVNAYIAQTGRIPVGTRALSMLATGRFQVLVDGVPIEMISAGD
jgi:hypothetical protein